MDRHRYIRSKPKKKPVQKPKTKDIWSSFCLYVFIARLLKTAGESSSRASSSVRGRKFSSNPDLFRTDLSSPFANRPTPSFHWPPAHSEISSSTKTAAETDHDLRRDEEAGPSTSNTAKPSLNTFKKELTWQNIVPDESVGVVLSLVKANSKSKKPHYEYISRYRNVYTKSRELNKRKALFKIFRSSLKTFLFYTIPYSSIKENRKRCLSRYCPHHEFITVQFHQETQTEGNKIVVKLTDVKSVQTDKDSYPAQRQLCQDSLTLTDIGESSSSQAGAHATTTTRRRILPPTPSHKSHGARTKAVTFSHGFDVHPNPAPYDPQLESLRQTINFVDVPPPTSIENRPAQSEFRRPVREIDINENTLDLARLSLNDYRWYNLNANRNYRLPQPRRYLPKVPPHNTSLFWHRHHSDRTTYQELSGPIESEVIDYFEEKNLEQDIRFCYIVDRFRFPKPVTLPCLKDPFDINVDLNGQPYCTPHSSPPASPPSACFVEPTSPTDSKEKMSTLAEQERKLIIEFCHLLEKSKQLFNGLRELPQYGHKQWHTYFGRTFDVYSKLWKFQQQHRAILNNKYGLKRWQIGEIASKIGQLYYHFYLRTSETAYLNEAYSFYHAIRGRSYYTRACREDRCELMVKKLRYYARFIVACLLLKKLKLVRDLVKELDRQIVEYGNTYDPDDQIEWTVVVDEVKAFIQSEPVVSVIHPDNYPIIVSHRISASHIPPVERLPQMNLALQEVIIVGSCSQQVKFSELTLDMFRMLQTLEREPTGEIQHMYDDSPRQRFNLTSSAIHNTGYGIETALPRNDNPHKYLLFKPTPSQILVYLGSACSDLQPNTALLLYISADGYIVQPPKHPEDIGYGIGGLVTTAKNELHRENTKDQKGPPKKESLVLYPGDVLPFTRRPLFIIIESDNSFIFQNMPRHFGQPMIIFMSPLDTPALSSAPSERRLNGSLFTLFLHSPLSAFCHTCDLHSVTVAHWDRAQSIIDTFMAEASLFTCRRFDPIYLSFMGDDFLRILILRYIFCEIVLRLHRSFRTRTQMPRCSPPIQEEIFENHTLNHVVLDLATHLQVRQQFHDVGGSATATRE